MYGYAKVYVACIYLCVRVVDEETVGLSSNEIWYRCGTAHNVLGPIYRERNDGDKSASLVK